MATPEIQVLNKQDFSQQFIVSLPGGDQLSPLKPSSVRVRTEVLSLTVNNTTYAKLGSLLGWWDVHPLPPNILAEFSDPQQYGRISAWGFGRVVESNFPDLPVDSLVYGYLPIGTLPVDLSLSRASNKREVLEVTPHRQHLLPIYNRYLTYLPSKIAELSQDFLGWSSLMQVLFETSWMLNRFVFAWEESQLVPPSGTVKSWSLADANVTDSVVIFMSGSGKTAVSLAHQFRHARPKNVQPRLVVGVTSPASQGFAEATGFYDKVLEYGASSADLAGILAIDSTAEVILLDFGSRGNSFKEWYNALKPQVKAIKAVLIGSTPEVQSPEAMRQGFADGMAMGRIQVNASDIMTAGMKRIGEDDFWNDFLASWKQFSDTGAVPGMSLEWGSSMSAVKAVWDAICSDKFDARKGYVFRV